MKSKLKNTNLRMQGTGFFIINLALQDKYNINDGVAKLTKLLK